MSGNGNDGFIRRKVRLEGISPLLMNPATEDLLNELDGGAAARKPNKMEETPEEKAAKKVIRNGEEEIGIPAEYLFSCLVSAGRLVKIDAKKNISTLTSTLLPSFLTIEEMFFAFEDQDVRWEIDRRRGKIPNNGTAVCITRPRFDRWAFSASILIDKNEITEERVRLLFDKAGAAIGLGDFRPSCRGPFGRFKVASWEDS